MENKENLVPNGTENTDAAAENKAEQIETPAKTYTEDEVNQIVGRKIARTKARIQKEYDRKYGDLEGVLKAGTGKETIEEVTDTFKQFYKGKGVDIPENRQNYSPKDIEILAKAEAEDIIRGGYEEVVEEMDRLTEIGAANMTAKEKAVFKALAEVRESTERGNELSKMGVTEDVYNSQDFKDFASQFKSSVPIAKIYEHYTKTQPKKEVKTMGSMKNTASTENEVKEYYSPEEARRFTLDELNKKPAVYASILESMKKW